MENADLSRQTDNLKVEGKGLREKLDRLEAEAGERAASRNVLEQEMAVQVGKLRLAASQMEFL